MIKLEKTEVFNWEAAIRGMRNPKNSWEKSDSYYTNDCGRIRYIIGPNDHKLMMQLAKAGSDHAKYRRQIFVSVDITAPLYWWKEFDTYKVGTVANSCSTMHKIHERQLTIDDFSTEKLLPPSIEVIHSVIRTINECRDLFLGCDGFKYKYGEADEKVYWENMIQLLPSSYNQKRTITMNYENLANMYKSRRNHKLNEWHVFCDWIKTLPYSEIITLEEEK